MGERVCLDVNAFAAGMKGGGSQDEIAIALWALLRERAVVPDFRPDPDDDLSEVFGMNPEIVRDEVVDELLAKLGLSASGINFTGFDFSSIVTPKDVVVFVRLIADSRHGEPGRRFMDMAK